MFSQKPDSKLLHLCLIAVIISVLCTNTSPAQSNLSPHGLLFHLSGDKGLDADYAAGDPVPNYVFKVNTIAEGAKGRGIRCESGQLLSYRAPSNIYAQRGTLSFFWRSVEPFTETEFPIFRVAYADHSSWDMVWLRIDYNGHGFDAFVTDANLARVRVSYTMPELPSPDRWTHFALAWDENTGIRFYIDGKEVARKDSVTVLDTGLDQFGTHSRIISPYQVQSAYNFMRGGDVDEIAIFDHALAPDDIRNLAQGSIPSDIAPVERDLTDKKWRDEWFLRYGWNRDGDMPPYLKEETTTIRKVGILEAYDLKRWWWKACDGIRETTWPGVYNRSRIAGRNDYFQLPDWDCYSLSGHSVRFNMPDEPWNYIEISGGADGTLAITPNTDGTDGTPVSSRSRGQERTFHMMDKPVTGQTVVFTNNVQETPIGEFDAFNIHSGDAPKGIGRLGYILTVQGDTLNPNIAGIREYIRGRYPADERSTIVARPQTLAYKKPVRRSTDGSMPIVHVIIPSDFRSAGPTSISRVTGLPVYTSYTWNNMYAGLDGIRIELPALDVQPVAGGLFPLNIKVKDPIWPLRNMTDVSVSVRPGEARILWLDLRDRILPGDKPLYMTIAGGPGFDAAAIEGAKVELVFKPWEDAKAEHVADRFTQARDNYAMIIEEAPNNRKLSKFTQFEADMTDLLRVDPTHKEGRNFWYLYNKEQPKPQITLPEAPAGIPAWAFRQLELLKRYRQCIEWYVDNRQIDNGEFGGGISDDTDFGNFFPPLALMGCMPDKLDGSLGRLLEAAYDQGMLTRGMSTIQTDVLHTFEEGVNTLYQINLMRPGDPKQVECLMESAKSVGEIALGVNKAGHTHLRSNYFSATKVAEHGSWAWPLQYGYDHLAPAILLGEMYGNRGAREQVIAVADGLMAHARTGKDGRMTLDTEINFLTDESRPAPIDVAVPVLWAAWKWTGDEKYLRPVKDLGLSGIVKVNSNMPDILGMREEVRKKMTEAAPGKGKDAMQHIAWQATGDKSFLESYYLNQEEDAVIMSYLNTEASIWTDRVSFPIEQLQRSRLGGLAHQRNKNYPGHAVSWRFNGPNTAEDIAILIPDATPSSFTVELFNRSDKTEEAVMTGWEVLGGKWEMIQGTDTDGDGRADASMTKRVVDFGRGRNVALSIPLMRTVVVSMKLRGKGADYNTRADLAVGPEDITIAGNTLKVRIHNLGSVASKPATAVLTDATGKVISQAAIPAIQAPNDLVPKTAEVTFSVPTGQNIYGCRITVSPKGSSYEIYGHNNSTSVSR